MARRSVDLIRKRMKRLGTVVAANETAASKMRWRFFVALGHAFYLTWPVLSALLGIQLVMGLLIGFVEGWSLGDAVYFTFITGLTIGYGDLVPRQALSRVLAQRFNIHPARAGARSWSQGSTASATTNETGRCAGQSLSSAGFPPTA